MKIRVFFFIISIALLGFTSYFVMMKSDFETTAEEIVVVTLQEHQKRKEPIQSNKPIHFSSEVHFAAIGDVLIHNSLYQDAKVNTGYDFTPMFSLVKPIISAADLAFANQETIMGGEELGLSSYPRFNSPFEIADALKDTGFDMISIANNHTLDRGEQAVQNAINHFNTIGLPYVGGYASFEDQKEIRVISKNRISFAFLAYTYGTNGIPVPKGKEYLVNLIDYDQIKQDLIHAEALADVTVVSVHFGHEYHLLPSNHQKELAQFIADHGGDIIVGHHPHVLQPVEWLKKPNGDKTFVAYSLGNFLSGQEGIYKEIGGIVQLRITKEVKDNQTNITLDNPSFYPTYTYKKRYRDYLVVPLKDADQYGLVNAKEYDDEIRNHISQWLPNLSFY